MYQHTSFVSRNSLWTIVSSIAPAPTILNYLREVASRHHIDEHVKFNHAVQSLDWSSELQKWKISVNVDGKSDKVFWARFVIMSTGYYDYKKVSIFHSFLTLFTKIRIPGPTRCNPWNRTIQRRSSTSSILAQGSPVRGQTSYHHRQWRNSCHDPTGNVRNRRCTCNNAST